MKNWRLLTAVLVAFGICLLVYNGRKNAHLGPVLPSSQRQTLSKWAKQEFTQISRTESFRKSIQSIPVDLRTSATQNEVKELHATIFELLNAISSGDYKQYDSFVARRRASVPSAKIQMAREAIGKFYPGKSIDTTSTLWTLAWNLTYKPKDGTSTGPLEAVSFQTGEITIFRGDPSDTMKVLDQLKGVRESEETVGTYYAPANFQSPVEHTGDKICATLKIIGKAKAPDPAYPIVLTFAYSEALSTWTYVSTTFYYSAPRKYEWLF